MYHDQESSPPITTFSDGVYMLGADENGVGPLAGPLVVTCVACSKPSDSVCRDSKTYKSLESMKRDVNNSTFLRAYSLLVSPNMVCRWGMSNALNFGFRTVVDVVRRRIGSDYIKSPCIMDGNYTHGVKGCLAYPKADVTNPVVSLASCIGKLRQVEAMRDLHHKYPEYGFDSHHGYGVKQHLDAIALYGVVRSVHRIKYILPMPRLAGTRIIIRDPIHG